METALRATQSATSRTDQELIVAVRRGSDRAFEELYSRYRSRIGSYVFGMVGDHARAEDIAQEVFISALRRLRDTERPIAFKPWLYEIAKNACIDEFRRTRRAREVPLDGDQEDDARPGHVELVGGESPDAAVENKQRLDDLRGAFRGLSESHHRIIVMREFEGLTYDQIGDRLGMSKAMVESTLFRARKRLGEEYEELVSGRRCEQIQAVIASGEQRPLRSLGLRDRRQLARHLSHCQPCRRCARMAGVEESLFQTPGVIGKIAALLPFPWLRWRRSHSRDEVVSASGTHQLAALQSLQDIVRLADPSAPSYGLGRAAATAAAIVIAGAGGGFVSGLGGHGNQVGAIRRALRPHSTSPAAAAAPATLRRAPSPIGSVVSSARSGSGAAGSRSSGGSAQASAKATQPGTGTAGAPGASRLVGSAPGGTNAAGSALQQPQAAASSTASNATAAINTLGSVANKVVGGATGSTTPTLPGVKVPQLPQNPLPPLPQNPLPPLPQNPLPPLPQPQPQLPTVSTPTTPQVPTPTVPGVTVPNPKSLLPPLGQKSG